VGVAVNVADAPAHSGFVPVVNAIVKEGVTDAFTVIVIEFEFAVTGLAHAAFEVSVQVTICPLVRVVVVNVELLVPAFPPFTFHW
jgi:hypothetical protein